MVPSLASSLAMQRAKASHSMSRPVARSTLKPQLMACLASRRDTFPLEAMSWAVLRGLLHQGVGCADPVDHADLQGFGRRNHLSCKDHFLGAVGADQSRQPLGTAKAGNEAKVDFRESESGVFRGIDEVACQGHLVSAAQGESIHCRDYRNGQALKFADNGLALMGENLGLKGAEGGELGDIGPGYKGFVSCPGKHEHPDILVLRHFVKGITELTSDSTRISDASGLRSRF